MTNGIGHTNVHPRGAKPPKAPKSEPQTLHDVVQLHQDTVDKMDTRLKEMSDPAWAARQWALAAQKRDAAQHELDILKAAEAKAA